MRSNNLARSLAIAAGLTALSGSAFAAGTAPGVIITNSVDITYTTGGSTITRENEDEISFVIDRKVDFLLEGEDASRTVTVGQGAANQQQTFRLLNEGNDVSAYDIDVSSAGDIGLTYDPTGSGTAGTYSVYIGSSSDPISGADTLYDTTGTVSFGDINADEEVFLKIVAHMPSGLSDGQSDVFTVTVTALDAGTSTVTQESLTPTLSGIDTFLADDDADGIQVDSETYLVSAPMLSATKTSTLVSEDINGAFDCANGNIDLGAEAYVPGACVEYTLGVSNASSASSAALGLVVTDPLPQTVTFVSVRANSGFDSVTELDGTVTATLSSLSPGASAEAKIRVTID